MPYAYRWAGAPAGGRPRVARPRRRAWRRRSRRAQVSAVATILGLLLVVTFIANYIATTLPNQMGQNDLQHELQLENQMSQLSALVNAIGTSGAIGAQVSQPLTLGSLGAPPFAAPDSSTLGPLATLGNTTGSYPLSTFNFTLSGQTHALSSSGSSAMIVFMRNTYVPAAGVIFDQGSVIFAEAGGIPIFVVPPAITFSHGVLTVFLPWFNNAVASESGNGGSDVLMRLVSSSSVSLPATGLTLASGSNVVITIVTPFAVVWYAYFESVSTLAPYASCVGASSVCSGSYAPGGPSPLGSVTLAIPASAITTLNAVTSVFSVNVA